ncbi:MAG: nucleotidyltransferase [Bacteroidales bacterium]|nr:nucleotidyltransferase [Bacteroidales bacterium]
MKPTLLILAAGMGSRYGSLKQMDGLGPNGEAIIDYSIYDAIRAGFGKIVFVIRHSFAEPFKEHFQAEKFGGDVKFEFVYQELEYLPEGYSVPEGRVKPWGTNHAVMMAKDVIKEPFAVINADDFYGKESYQTMADYLRSIEGTKGKYSMIGYRLENTLSDFGSVSRGVCETDSNGLLTTITERTAISRKGDKVVFAEGDTETELDPTCPVSMNFWGFTPEYFDYSEDVFKEFLDGALASGNLKAEFFIPYIVDKLIARGQASVKVLDCDAKWFGVTYKEDRPFTVEKINALISAGVYPKKIREF